ncbi:MAG TPA: serine hydrolase domain-containing protein [Pyrinomonadaceae bacterium]|nr:serine hydrolase domain-containing protein [Pyrinomonadaceae bacterium]
MRVSIRQLAYLVLFAISCGTPCAAQQTLEGRIDAFIKGEMQRQQIPGMAVAVVRNGKIALLRTYGFSNLEHRIPVKPETIFQSGSIGKQFTATAVMILAAEGKLSLEDKLSKFFPDAPESWSRITVRQLLTHSAGMADYPTDFDLRRDHTEAELLTMLKATPLAYPPGTSWDYSNLGYVTLGILIHQVSGKSHSDFVAERIFKPLGMETARLISEADIVPNRAAGYRLVDGKLQNQEWVSPSTNTTADGCYYFSILDLAKWDAGLYANTPLAQARLAEMWTPVKLSGGRTKAYGFGWNTDFIHGRRILFHGGAWQGFKSFIVRFPDEKTTFILMANSWEARDFRLARGLVAAQFPEFALPAARLIADNEPKVTAMIRRVLLQVAQGNANPDSFTQIARASFFPNQAKAVAERLNSLSLPIALIFTNELMDRREESGFRVYRYALTDIGKSLVCTIRLTNDDKVAGLECEAN